MNQGIAFARTIRALDADSFRASKLTLLLAVTILAAWIWWAFAARFPQYQTYRNVHVDLDAQTALAYLPDAHPRIGEHAILRTTDSSLAADITGLTHTPEGLRITFHLPQSSSRSSGTYSIDLETERVSPAVIALRTAGLKY